ncbi:MAG TPA: hypothetical protein VFP61_07640 [Acidimicrobiales bacterium]|nr:hypothetical protein [Acidimicrobiales bacterium]
MDPQGSTLTAMPGAWSTADPSGASWPDNDGELEAIRFVPASPFDPEPYGQLYETVRERIISRRWAHAAVLTDELETAMPSNGADPRSRGFVYRDTKLPTFHITTATRPKWVAKVNLTNARYAGIFAMPERDDRAYLAGCFGIPVDQLEQLMAALPEKGFLWWDQVARTLQPSRLTL